MIHCPRHECETCLLAPSGVLLAVFLALSSAKIGFCHLIRRLERPSLQPKTRSEQTVALVAAGAVKATYQSSPIHHDLLLYQKSSKRRNKTQSRGLTLLLRRFSTHSIAAVRGHFLPQARLHVSGLRSMGHRRRESRLKEPTTVQCPAPTARRPLPSSGAETWVRSTA